MKTQIQTDTKDSHTPFKLGFAEAFTDTGMTYGDPDSPDSVAYDIGRTVGEMPEPWRTRIVTSLASHAALVDALRALLGEAEAMHDDLQGHEGDTGTPACFAAARAALALEEKGGE